MHPPEPLLFGAQSTALNRSTGTMILIRQSRIKVNADEITHFSEKPGDLLESAIQIEG
jgi:hypothetical protein